MASGPSLVYRLVRRVCTGTRATIAQVADASYITCDGPLAAHMEYDMEQHGMPGRALFTVRASANVLDWAIVAVLFHLCSWTAGALDHTVAVSLAGARITINGSLVGWLTVVAYFAMEVPLRQTIGKMVFRVAVTSCTSERLALSRRLIRYMTKNVFAIGVAIAMIQDIALVRTALQGGGLRAWAEWMTFLVIALGLLSSIISFVRVALSKRALHDLLAQTDVLNQEHHLPGFPVE